MTRKISREREQEGIKAAEWQKKQAEKAKKNGRHHLSPQEFGNTVDDEGLGNCNFLVFGRRGYGSTDEVRCDGSNSGRPCVLQELRDEGTVNGGDVIPKGANVLACKRMLGVFGSEAEIKRKQEEERKEEAKRRRTRPQPVRTNWWD